MPLLEQVLEHNPDTVKIVLKNMPLNFHELAAPAALAALAAGNQGKFWEYHDELFATPKLNQNSFEAIAKKLNLDLNQFRADLQSPTVHQQLAKDLQDAKEAGVSGTPTIFVNGIKVKRRELSVIQKLIDEALAK